VSTFLALLPTGGALDALRGLDRPSAEGVLWEPERRWHITLRFTPVDDEPTQRLLIEVAEEAAAGLAPLVIELGTSTQRLGSDGTLVIPAMGASKAAARLDELLDGRLGGRDHGYFGHLTLARLRRGRSLPSWLLGQPLRTRFLASEMVLVRSTPGPGGSVYDFLYRVPFRGGSG
jgi:2'-5' RNA ligase